MLPGLFRITAPYAFSCFSPFWFTGALQLHSISCAPLTTRRGHGDINPTDPRRARRLHFPPSTTLTRGGLGGYISPPPPCRRGPGGTRSPLPPPSTTACDVIRTAATRPGADGTAACTCHPCWASGSRRPHSGWGTTCTTRTIPGFTATPVRTGCCGAAIGQRAVVEATIEQRTAVVGLPSSNGLSWGRHRATSCHRAAIGQRGGRPWRDNIGAPGHGGKKRRHPASPITTSGFSEP